MPGVTIGDHSIVGSGSVVMRDVPAHSLVMGNPARVIERGIDTTHLGRRAARPEASNDESGTAPTAHLGTEGERT
jgi:serine acetyltransferase